MAVDANQRKRNQRNKQKQNGDYKVEITLKETHKRRLDWVCETRGYDKAEYIALLIHRDAERLESIIDNMGTCLFCNESLPKGCIEKWKGHGKCFHTIKKRETLSL